MRTGQQEAGGPWGLELTGPNRPEPRFEPPIKRQQEAPLGFHWAEQPAPVRNTLAWRGDGRVLAPFSLPLSLDL